MAQPAQKKRRSLAYWGIAALAGIFALVSVAWITLQMDAARRAITNSALAAVEGDDLKVSYGSLAGNWPWRISITKLEVADQEGTWLEVDQLTLTWSPFATISGQFKASRIALDGVTITRLPESEPTPDPNRQILPALPELPLDLQVASLEVSNLFVADGVIGPAVLADIQSALVWTDDRIDAQLQLRELKESGLTTAMTMNLNRVQGELDLKVDGRDGDEGLLRKLIDPDLRDPIEFSFDGAGPGSNWNGSLQVMATDIAELSGTVSVTNPAPLSIEATANLLPGGKMQPQWKDVLGNKASITVKAHDATLDQATIDELTVETASGTQIFAKGQVNGATSSIAASLNGTIDNAEAFSALLGTPLSGKLSVRADVSGSLNDPAIDATVDGDNVVVDSTAFGTVTGDVGWPGARSKQGAINLAIQSPLGPGAVSANVTRPSDGSIRLSDITADWLTTKVSGDAILHTDETVSGELSFDIASLEKISFLTQFAGISDIGGAARGVIVLPAPELSGPTRFDATLTNFRYGNGTEMIGAKSIEASGTISSEATGNLSVKVFGEEMILPGLYTPTTLNTLSISAKGIRKDTDWELTVTNINQINDRLSMSGSYGRNEQDLQEINLSAVTGVLLGKAVRLERSASISERSDGWIVAPISLQYGDGTAEVAATIESNDIKADITLVNLPLQVGGESFDTINSTLTGQISLDTISAQKTGAASIQLQSRAGANDLGVTSVSAEWDGARVIMSGDLAGAGQFDGSLALTYANGQFNLPDNGTIGFSAKLNGAIGPLWRLAPYSEYELKGQGGLDFAATGTWSDPKITGTAELRDGYFESFGDGVFLKDLSLDLQANNSEKALMTLSATDGKKGKVSGTGEIVFQAGQHLPLKITADFDKAEILRSENIDAQLSGRVTLEGYTDNLSLAGDMIINRMDIRIPNDLPPSVIDLPAEYVNVPPALKNITTSETGDAENPIALNIKVQAPNRIFVEGRGLNSEWKSKLLVSGDTNMPRIEGTAQVVKGTFEFAGRPFDLKRGVVTFDGGKEIAPRLDVLASREDDDITVSVRVKGPASDPDLSFQSSPNLPQEDVLARVLFGKPVAELSYVELAQLGESLATLSGKGLGGGGRGFFGNVRQSLGVDVLSVDTGSIAGAADDEEAVGPSLTVGKYVTDRVYVGVTQGTDEDSTAVEVEVDITRRLSLSTEVGQKANSNIGLNWSWDY